MDRVKLIDRAKKLFAMSQDLSSPAEAGIASRRLKVLMKQHGITIGEIRGTEREDELRARNNEARRSSVRRRRARPPVNPKQKLSSAQINGLVALSMACGFVLVLVLWLKITGVEQSAGENTRALATMLQDGSTVLKDASLQARVERAFVIEGEPIVLYINGVGLSAEPVTSRLSANFSIVNTTRVETSNQSFQIRMELLPRQTGVSFIPSLVVDGVKSERITIDVAPGK